MMRRIEFFDEQQQRTLVFLTNNMKLAAATVAEIDKNRWQIELFFKALKQSCKKKGEDLRRHLGQTHSRRKSGTALLSPCCWSRSCT